MAKTKVTKSHAKPPVVIARSVFNDVAIYINSHKLEIVILFSILLLALFLRVYRISEFLTFLGDEGRDVRIVRDLITKGNLVFIGPQTSIGGMYLGPLYYYLIAPSLALSLLSPVGPAVFNALLGVATVGLIWFVAKKWFGTTAAQVAAFLYAISPVAIIYSRSSWNPNPMPFFALLCVYGIYEVWQNKKLNWLPWVSVSFAFALQMHYLGLLLIPVIGFFWLLTFFSIKKDQKVKNVFIKKSIYAILIFLIMMSPLLLFDLKHQGMNFNAFKAFFTDRQTTVNLNPARSDRFLPVMLTTVTDLVLARQKVFALYGLIILTILSIFGYRKSPQKSPWQALFIWLGFAILGLGVYKQHVYIHYLGFIYPAVYLLLGGIVANLYKNNLLSKILATLLLIYLGYQNLYHNPVREAPNRQLQRTEAAVDLIIKYSGDKPFNFGLIAKQNYDESYRYFLENKKAKMVRGEEGITDQLFVICEDEDKCQPEGNPAYQIAIFGPSSVVDSWQIDYLKIYRLIKKQ